MDVRIRVLFIILLLWQIGGFFQNKNRNLDEEVADLERRVKLFSNEIQGIILIITKIFALIMLGINTLLLIYSLQVLHYGWLRIIPVVSFLILNCDLTIFFSNSLIEYLHRGNHKWIKPLRVWYLVAAIAWFGLMVVIP